MKANAFPGSQKHHVNLLLCRLSYEPFWFFTSIFSFFSLLLTGQGWVSPKGITGGSQCPSVSHISPPCPSVPVEKKCVGGRKEPCSSLASLYTSPKLQTWPLLILKAEQTTFKAIQIKLAFLVFRVLRFSSWLFLFFCVIFAIARVLKKQWPLSST